MLVSVQRFICVGDVRIETTHCWWCTDDAVCSACSAKADKVRAARAIAGGRRGEVQSRR